VDTGSAGSNVNEVHCWGANGAGQLGKDPAVYYTIGMVGSNTTYDKVMNGSTLVAGIGGTGEFADIVAIGNSTCVAHAQSVWCWGDIVGTFTPTDQTPALSSESIVQLQTNGTQVCVLTSSGAVKCNVDGTIALPGGASASAIAMGTYHSCAVLSSGGDSGSVVCWGETQGGLLGWNPNNVGDDETPASVGPVPVFTADGSPPP
jgi:hypothetical protein